MNRLLVFEESACEFETWDKSVSEDSKVACMPTGYFRQIGTGRALKPEGRGLVSTATLLYSSVGFERFVR